MKLIGIITSDKMDKTRVVAVSEKRHHRIYKKSFTVTSKIKAHDENNEYKKGETVEIESTRPISADKAWKIVGKIG